MLTPTVLEILMSKGRSVLSPSQQGTRNEMINGFNSKDLVSHKFTFITSSL